MATGGEQNSENYTEQSAWDATEGAILEAMPNQDFDEAVNAMQNEILKISESVPLVSNKYDLSLLANDYAEDDTIYQRKIKLLSEKYRHVRNTRGDGNCFYRAFGFGYLEQLLTDKDSFSNFRAKASATKENLEKLGYQSFTVEDFHDRFMEVVDSVGSGISVQQLMDTFCDEGLSNYLVVYLRLITSCHLQHNHEFFQNFVDGDRTVEDFCKGEVEPMDRESDHIHIIALTGALDVCVRVAYVDRADSDEITFHDFPEGSVPQLHLLYRPGHYDVIYPR